MEKTKREAKKIIFELPILVDGKEVKEVTMRVPKVKDMLAVDHINNPVEREIALIGNLTDLQITMDDVEEWDAAEYTTLQSTLMGLQRAKAKIL